MDVVVILLINISIVLDISIEQVELKKTIKTRLPYVTVLYFKYWISADCIQTKLLFFFWYNGTKFHAFSCHGLTLL